MQNQQGWEFQGSPGGVWVGSGQGPWLLGRPGPSAVNPCGLGRKRLAAVVIEHRFAALTLSTARREREERDGGGGD